jgi:hypothetical protein
MTLGRLGWVKVSGSMEPGEPLPWLKSISAGSPSTVNAADRELLRR